MGKLRYKPKGFYGSKVADKGTNMRINKERV